MNNRTVLQVSKTMRKSALKSENLTVLVTGLRI